MGKEDSALDLAPGSRNVRPQGELRLPPGAGPWVNQLLCPSGCITMTLNTLPDDPTEPRGLPTLGKIIDLRLSIPGLPL